MKLSRTALTALSSALLLASRLAAAAPAAVAPYVPPVDGNYYSAMPKVLAATRSALAEAAPGPIAVHVFYSGDGVTFASPAGSGVGSMAVEPMPVVLYCGTSLPLTLCPAPGTGSGSSNVATPTAAAQVPVSTGAGSNYTARALTASDVGADAAGAASTPVAGSGTPRGVGIRFADDFHVNDYNASASTLGTFCGTTVQTLAACSINGVLQYAWATNTSMGYTFAMTSSSAVVAGGTSASFTQTLGAGGPNDYSATAPQWKNPIHGNYVVLPGMLVSASCLPAGTLTTTVGSDETVTSNFGQVAWNTAATGSCASGTTYTFALSPAQIAALTFNDLAAETAAYRAAVLGNRAHIIFASGQTYLHSHPITIPNDIGSVVVEGSGFLQPIGADFGKSMCGIGDGNRGQGGSRFYDITYYGPNATRTVNAAPNQMFDICLGASGTVREVNTQLGWAGIAMWGDHGNIYDTTTTNNYFGVYLGDYTATYGNQVFARVAAVGNTLSSYAKAATNSWDFVNWDHGHTGFGPFALFCMAPTANVSTPKGAITHSKIDHMGFEALGNGGIYCPSSNDNVAGNKFIASGDWDVGQSGPIGAYTISLITAGNSFSQNSFDGTSVFPHLNLMTSAAIVTPDAHQISFRDDYSVVSGANGTKSYFSNGCSGCKWDTADRGGVFATASSSVSPQLYDTFPLADLGNGQIGTYTTGSSIFAGIPANGGVLPGINFALAKYCFNCVIAKAPGAVSTEVDPGHLMNPATSGFVPVAGGVTSGPVISGSNGDPSHTQMNGTVTVVGPAIY